MTDPMTYEQAQYADRRVEVQDAMARARQQLAEVLANGDEVTRVTSSLRTMRERNRYGERMALALRPKEHPA